MCFAPQRRAIFRHRTVKKWPEPASFLAFWLTNVLRATAACHFSGSWLAKWLRSWGVLYILTDKCASRHSGVRLLQIETCKMAPTMRCFVHFDWQMCFAPTAACHFSGSWLAKWLRSWGVLYIFTYKCASRHSRVQFFITPLSSYLRTRRFYEATFRTAGSTNHWKNTAIRDVANISRTCIFFSTRLDSTLLFYTTWLAVVHCFSTLLCNFPYCRKLDF